MKTKKEIEKMVSAYYKVPVKELYLIRNEYPHNGLRSVLMWLLYSNGVKVYDIADLFGCKVRLAYHRIAKVQVALKSDTRIKADVTEINQMLNTKN